MARASQTRHGRRATRAMTPSTNHLHILACHGVCLDPVRPEDDASWSAIYPNEAGVLTAHVREARRLAGERQSVLAFSGGDTRPGAYPLTEASTCAAIAVAASWWNHPNVAKRV